MLTANWSGFSISPDALLGRKKCSRAYHPSIEDEDDDEDDYDIRGQTPPVS